MKSKLPLFLFPGLSCTDRLFAMQKEGLSDLMDVIVPDWLKPHSYHTLISYAKEWGEKIWKDYFAPEAPEENRYEVTRGCYLGGMSFGGMIAPIIGEVLESKGVKIRTCFCISTVRYGDQFPRRLRYWRLLNISPDGCWLTIGAFCRMLIAFSGKRMSWARHEVYQQVIDTPPRRNFHVIRMFCSWHGPQHEYDFPIMQIHGGRDSVLPVECTNPDEVITKGGHCLPLTSGKRLNDLIAEQYKKTCD